MLYVRVLPLPSNIPPYTNKRTKLSEFFTFQDEFNSSGDGGVLTGSWIWTYIREPTVVECHFALRGTEDTLSPLST